MWKQVNSVYYGEIVVIAGVSDRCPRKLMWLKTEVMTMMGPYLSRLKLMELDAASHDQLCEFFMSQAFSSSFRGVAGMNPVLARRFLDRIQNCTKGLEFSQQVERMQQRYKPAQSLPLGNYFSRPMAGLGRLIPTTYIR
ncbi:hypothetical protein N1851_012444 [Merluccius polli]|uniref:Uncharacterized protein n=1 Tax=Merluccius polli TaxID=89951 RepID=A0AA47P4B0_MERPO|nr:hypothetical protein N1851_012444 [Merluccius polli]